MLRHTMFKSIKSIRLCDACLHTANTRDNKSERFPSIDAPINNPPFSILNNSHFSLLKRLAAPFIWELTYNREVNQNEGLSVLMTQGSLREVVPFNPPPPQKKTPRPSRHLPGYIECDDTVLLLVTSAPQHSYSNQCD